MKQYKARRAAPHAQPRSTRHTPNECDPRDIRSTLRLSRAGPRPPPRCVQGANWTKLEPHVFATSEMAYNHMVINAQSQSLLVAGESVRRTPRHMHIMRRPPPLASSSNRRCEPHVLAPHAQPAHLCRRVHDVLGRARARRRRTSSCSTTSSGARAASVAAPRPFRRCAQPNALFRAPATPQPPWVLPSTCMHRSERPKGRSPYAPTTRRGALCASFVPSVAEAMLPAHLRPT